MKDIIGAKMDAVREGLRIESVSKAQERGRKLDLWETAEALLRELEKQT
jgi:hypothetical protein